jgi:hypothetical protein
VLYDNSGGTLMHRNILFILIASVMLSLSVTAADQAVKDVKAENKPPEQGIDPEINNVLMQSQKSREKLSYNTYITGELKNLKVEVDLYNTKFCADSTYMLVPVRIVNKSAQEISLDAAKDKLFLVFRRQTGYEPYQLMMLNFPGRIEAGKDIVFAGRYNFKSYDERLGVEISMKFLKMIVDGLNTGKGRFKKNELASMEKQMQFNSKGRFDSGTLGAAIPLEYKIVKK